MEGQQFDALTRAVAASSASRRSLVRSVFGALSANVLRRGGHAAASGPASDGDSATPVTCTDKPCFCCSIDDLSTFSSCQPCTDPCLGDRLATAAASDSAVLALTNELQRRGFQKTAKQQVLTIAEAVSGYLQVYENRTDRKHPREAHLIYTSDGAKQAAVAFLFRNHSPETGLGVDVNGEIVALDVSTAENGVRALFVPQAQAALDAGACDTCRERCEKSNGTIEDTLGCGTSAVSDCASFRGTASLACSIVAGIGCNGLDELCSKLLCEGRKQCPPPCDPVCENRNQATGTCIDLCTRSNTHCSGGACVCDGTACGEDCCAPGEVCKDGICTTDCGPCSEPDDNGQCFNLCADSAGVSFGECCVGPDNPGGMCCMDELSFCCRGVCCEHHCSTDGTCCPSAERLCLTDDTCCPLGDTCTINDGCCPSDQACNGEYCCTAEQTCCQSGCCDGPCDSATEECCSEQHICGDQCCPEDRSFCCNGVCCEHHCDNTGQCCPTERLCPSDDTCCPEGYTCFNQDHCCPIEQACDNGTCCPEGQTCCADGCCDGTCLDDGTCCPDERTCDDLCCPDGQECCQDGTCKPAGTCCVDKPACGDSCCEPGQTCCGDQCCDGPCDASGEACCSDSGIACGNSCCRDDQTCCGDTCCDGPCDSSGTACCGTDARCGGVCCGSDEQCCYGVCIDSEEECDCPSERDCGEGIGCCQPGQYCSADYDDIPICCNEEPCGGYCCAGGDLCLNGSSGSFCCGADMITSAGECCGTSAVPGVACGDHCCYNNEVCTADGCCSPSHAIDGRCCIVTCHGACCELDEFCGSEAGEPEHCIQLPPL